MTDDYQEQVEKLARLCAMLDEIDPPAATKKHEKPKSSGWIWRYRWTQFCQQVRRFYWKLGRLIS